MKHVRGALVVVSLINALAALGGGVSLLLPGAAGVPLSSIEGAGFSSFLVPALLLLLVIGGTQTLAAVTALRRARHWLFWNAFAGFALVIWVFVELAIMGAYSFLHGVCFGSGLLQLIGVLLRLDVWGDPKA